jgi:hypothetical protein
MTQDHRKRILDHQEKAAAEQRNAVPPSDPQLKIPLIGEVRRPEPPPPRLRRPRAKKLAQPELPKPD